MGFDNERHVYGDERYPAQLVLQDVLTIHGKQFKDAALIVASPPCQAYSYRAMPWKRAKALPPPDNSLFDACFRIQREAIAAAGHFIPLVVENVRGAQPYVGRSKYHFGSFHLWGDVPALMVMTRGREVLKAGVTHRRDGTTNFHRQISKAWRDKHYDDTEKMQIAGDGCKQVGSGAIYFDQGASAFGSRSRSRKRASAMIAKIPLVLSRHIARCWLPC